MAARRLLTMANLFENLNDIYGDREVLDLAEPRRYRLFPPAALTCRDCLQFTKLAAEAFIRGQDLKKGERVILLVPDRGEALLIAAALIKAGGIVVPVDHTLSASEVRVRAASCGATMAVVDGKLLSQRPEVALSVPGVERVVASGTRYDVPGDVPSLDECMDSSSGFFLPYTLKPSNVVGLFHTRMEDGSLKAVMVTNQGLLGPQLLAAVLLPSRPGGLCLHALDPWSVSGFSSAVLGLCMGLRMRFEASTDPVRILTALEAARPAAFMAESGTYDGLLRAGAGEYELSSVRLWLAAGEPLRREVPEAFRRPSRWRKAVFVEAYGAGGRATVLALKTDLPFFAWPERWPGLVIPPNRAAVFDGDGRRLRHGGEGELAIRGPAVTPGYWNDVEGTLAVKRNGWLHTGVKASVNRLLIQLL